MFWKNWKHITKLDPDKEIGRDEIRDVCESGTDAVIIGGTQNITRDKIAKLAEALNDFDIPKILEPSHPDVIYTNGIDYLFVPTVLNSSEVTWIIYLHKEWVKNYDVDWNTTFPEGYIILNPNSAVAKLTKAVCNLDVKDILAYAKLAEKYYRLPIVYLEYSGKFGDPEVVRAVSEALSEATLFYGGGIDSREKAMIMAEFADVIVVGNVLYEKGVDALLDTIP